MLLVFDVIQRLSTPLCIHQRRYIRVLWKKLSTCKFRCLTKCIEWSPYILTFDMSSHELAVTKIRRSEILFFWWKTGTPRFVTVHKNLDGLPVNMVANHFWWCDPNSIQTRNVANLLVVCFLSLSLDCLGFDLSKSISSLNEKLQKTSMKTVRLPSLSYKCITSEITASHQQDFKHSDRAFPLQFHSSPVGPRTMLSHSLVGAPEFAFFGTNSYTSCEAGEAPWLFPLGVESVPSLSMMKKTLSHWWNTKGMLQSSWAYDILCW